MPFCQCVWLSNMFVRNPPSCASSSSSSGFCYPSSLAPLSLTPSSSCPFLCPSYSPPPPPLAYLSSSYCSSSTPHTCSSSSLSSCVSSSFSCSYPGYTPAPPHVRHHHRLQPAIAPRCLPGLTFPDFDLAPKRNEKFGYCGLDLL